MKRITAFLLTFILFVTPITAFGNETISNENAYIPIRNAAEGSGAKVKYTDGSINISYKGDVYEYSLSKQTAIKNGEEIALTKDIIMKNGISYMDYDDLSYLFLEENDLYPKTKKMSVIYAYQLMSDYDVPGLSIAFVDAEKDYKWTRGFGYSDIENRKYINENTTMSIASISKVFTAMSVFSLIEQGKLDLNEKVITYLPDLNIKPHPIYGGDYKEVTLKMLLAHMSGIPSDLFGMIYTSDDYDKEYVNDFVENINKEYMDNKPLYRWNYANNAYGLLGIIVAKVAGYENSFDGFVDYTNKVLFEKMNMTNSSFELNKNIKDNLASSYSKASEGKKEDLLINAISAGGVYSTSKDMANLITCLLNDGTVNNKKVLNESSVKQMLSPSGYDMTFSGGLDMGLGTYKIDYNGIDVVGHNGSVAYFNSCLTMNKENKLGTFVSGNSTSSLYASSFLSYFILERAFYEKTGKTIETKEPLVTNPKEISKEELEKYTGYYTGLGKITITEDNKLSLDDLGLIIEYQDDGSFYDVKVGRLYFEKVKDLDVIFFGEDKLSVVAEKIYPEPADESFSKWEGKYLPVKGSENEVPMMSEFEISKVGEFPAFSFSTADGQKVPGLLLKKINDNSFYILGTARNYGKVINFYEKDGNKYADAMGITMMKTK